MTIPTGTEVYEGEIATHWVEDGILISLSKTLQRTEENIRDNVKLVKSITQGQPVPLMIFLVDAPLPDKATRKYVTSQLPLIYTAMAMVSKPGLAQLISNFLFAFKKPPIPMRSFTDPVEARQWLQQYRASAN